MPRAKFSQFDILAQDALTRDDIDWLNYEGIQDTVKQILKGNCYYYGYECARHCDNDIPIVKPAEIQNRQPTTAALELDRYEQVKITNRLIALFAKTYRVSWEAAEIQVRKALDNA